MHLELEESMGKLEHVLLKMPIDVPGQNVEGLSDAMDHFHSAHSLHHAHPYRIAGESSGDRRQTWEKQL